MDVGFLTSWNDRCGIAEYSRHLVDALRERVGVEVVPATFLRSPRSVYSAMGSALNLWEVAHVQHSYAFFGGMHPLRSGWGALAGALSRPMLLTVHELDTTATGAYRLPPAVEVAYKRSFNRSVFLHRAVGGWIVHAAALRDALVELGAPEERVLYRPLPMSPPPARVPNAAGIRKSLRLEGKRVLVILGFLSRRKGYDLALQALRSLPPEYVLVAAGGEHASDQSGTAEWLRGEATRAGVEDRLRVTGYLAEEALDDITALADVILAPFRGMSASASLVYSLARRKAVIASDLPENRTLDCVRLFPTGDAAALATAIREVTAAPALRRDLEQRAAGYASAHGFSALADETIRVYEDLLQEKKQ